MMFSSSRRTSFPQDHENSRPHFSFILTMAESPVNQAEQEFLAGLTACLRSWSALRTAVESGWGGTESNAKAQDLREIIARELPKLEVEDLTDNLAIYMEEEFSVTLEDESERQVADTLFRLYEQCQRGDFSLARELVTQQAAAEKVQFPVNIQSSEVDDDDEDMSDADVGESNMAEYGSQYLFGAPPKPKPVDTRPVRQLGEAVPEKVVEVDDDGFAPVSKRKGRR